MKRIAATLAITLLTGCASAGGGTARDLSVLTREEIVEANQMTALELVRTERPHWLHRRGARTVSGETEIAVYLDGTRIGGPDALASIPAITVQRMRYFSEREAQFRWGVGHLHGAIEVISTKG